MSPKYLQLIKLLAKMATKGAGKVPGGVKGSATRTPYKARPSGGKPRVGDVRGAPPKRPLPNENEADLIARMKSEYSNTPQGPPVSTPLSKALAGQAKKGNLNPQGRLKRLETSPEQFMNDLAGGSLHKGKGGPIQLTKEELKILEDHVKTMKKLKRSDPKPFYHEYEPMRPGDSSLNAALLSALGSGAGAAGLGGALQNRSRGSAGGSPQPPSR